MLGMLERVRIACLDCRESVEFDERRITVLGGHICGDCARSGGAPKR